MIRSCAISDPGRTHAENEDNHFADDVRGLYAVSDGVGSYRGAATASRAVVAEMSSALVGPASPDVLTWIREAVTAAARRVCKEGEKDASQGNMSATLTLLMIDGEDFWTAQVGDSRAYLFQDGRLRQITNDHTLAYEQYLAGAISKDDIQSHPNQKLLTRVITAGRDFAIPEFTTGKVRSGDIFVVCSDGLTKELTDEEIRSLCADEPDPNRLCATLVEAANGKGGRDNITVIVVVVG